jgi:aspartyl-tRNA(Asn)/glutamyl-tRNA(Gln) amidotransferase subunit B
MNYLTTIGLETHIQLKTETKVFCGCPNHYGDEPNTNVCPVCLGYPGVMPVLNEEAVSKTVMAGLLIGCEIGNYCKFDRKSYFYPDMPKNYQITQYDKPFCIGGQVEIEVEGERKTIRVNRIHLEEDVAKNTHATASSEVDFNRAGTPLMEIVSEADMESPEEAFAYLQALRQIMVYGGISACDLEKGNMRCDVNISVRPEGQQTLGTKTEIKNMNTFKGVLQAARAEVTRQISVLESGGTISQETLRFDPDALVTLPMRSKEYAHDYRYFPEPDLMPVVLERAYVEELRGRLPELPVQRRDRFVREFNLPEYDAGVLTAEKSVADYYEAVVQAGAASKAASNWIMTEVMRVLSEAGKPIEEFGIEASALAELIKLTDAKTINSSSAKEVFAIMLEEGGRPEDIVKARGMAQVSDVSAIDAFVDQALAENPKSVEDYKNGKKAALQFLVGQVMRFSKGKANPQMAAQVLQDRMNAM